MNITMYHLHCFKTVAEQGNFTKAAEMLYMTQPSLSRMMASLEKEWDVALFTRTTRSVRLTPEGQRCLDSVTKILEEYGNLEKKLKNMKHLRSGDLNIGYNSPSEPPVWFETALLKMRDNYPSVALTVRQSNTREAVQAVVSGELDCAMVFEHKGSMPEGLQIVELDKTARYAMLSPTHRLAAKKEIRIADLEGETLVIQGDNEKLTRRDLKAELSRQEVKVKRELEVRSITEMAFQVGLTQAIGVTALIDSFSGKGSITFRRIPELTHANDDGHRALIWKIGDKNPSIPVFRNILVEELLRYQKETDIIS